MSKSKKILKVVACVLAAALILALLGAWLMFRKELATLNSIEKLDDAPFYVMDYQADYGLDEFLEQGAATDQELSAFVIQKLMKGLPVTITLPDLSCSTFNARLSNGDAVFGRNFDNPYKPCMLVHTDPENGYESISMVNLGYVGYGDDYVPEGFKNSILSLAAPYIPLDGVNEKGLSIGVLQLDVAPTHQDNGKTDITTSSAIRMVLDKAATVDEAVALLEQYDMHASANSCFHFQIADANGDSVIVEYVDNVFSLVEPTKDFQWCTNFFLTPGEWYNTGKGQDRYEILERRLTEADGVLADEAAAMDCLEAAAQESTFWSAVYNNTTAAVELSLHGNFDRTYRFTLKDW